jgi:hypothetical protein
MQITIISPTRIEIDGEDAGMPLDLFLSREDLRPQIREEFVAWHVRHLADDRAREAAADKRVADIQAECDAKVAAIEADMAVLGTKEEAVAMRRQKEREDLKRRLEQLDAEESGKAPR